MNKIEEKRFFIINYKETTTDTDNVMNVECGTFDYAFESEDEAKKSLIDVAQRKVEDFDGDEQEELTENWNEDKDFVCIGYYEDTYEYSIQMVIVS